MKKIILLVLLCVPGSPPQADFPVVASAQRSSADLGGGGRAGSTDLRGQGPHSHPVGRGFQPDVPTLDGSAAIALINTTAFVVGNTITDNAWPLGILLKGQDLPDGSSPPATVSLLCANTISGLQNAGGALEKGIQSSYNTGYVKLNSITLNDIGYKSITHDKPKLIFNTITDNLDLGIDLSADQDRLDISGVHGLVFGSDDYAAFNTITGPSVKLNYSGG